jgi:acyl-CoA synthetase (AMP-forming)/AMP-acid ligase II
VPDPKWGETPLAVIVSKDPSNPLTSEDIERHTREHLVGYQRPRCISLTEVLPRNPGGKVLKTELRAAYSAGNLVSQPAV